MIGRPGRRRVLSAGVTAALILFALVGAWHHHSLSLHDDAALDRPEHGIASGPCHVCKLSTAGVTVPAVHASPRAAPPSGEIVRCRPVPAPLAGFDPSSPARAPPAPTNA